MIGNNMASGWVICLWIISICNLCPVFKADDSESAPAIKAEKEQLKKPWYVDSINVTVSDGPSAKKLAEKIEKNNTTEKSLNSSSGINETNSEPWRPKWLCSSREMPENTTKTVLVTNDVVVQSWINGTIANATGRCALVLFYTKFCSFCANMAPLYNAVGRAVSNIPVIAIDAYTYTSLNARFGVVAVPTIMLFYNGKPVLKFNNTKTFEALKTFLTNNTGLTLDSSVQVSQQDYEGPLSSTPEHYTDYHLVFSTLFLLAFGVHLFIQSQYCLALWNRLRNVSWSKLPVINLFLKDKRD